MNVDPAEFAALTAELARVARLVEILAVRVEENTAAHFGGTTPRPAPARRVQRRSDRPGHLRVVGGGQP